MTKNSALPTGLSDRQIVALYSAWSEDTYAAGFMSLDDIEGLPKSFLRWVTKQGRPQEFEDYELDLISRWRRMEHDQALYSAQEEAEGG